MPDGSSPTTTPALDLYEALAQRHKVASDRYEANQFSSDQKQLWIRLLTKLRAGTPDPSIVGLCDRLPQDFNEKTFTVGYTKDGQTQILASAIPLLSSDIVNQLISMLPDRQYSIAAAIFVECHFYLRDFMQPVSPSFLVSILRYLTGGIAPQDISSRFAHVMATVEQATAQSLQSAEVAQNSISANKDILDNFLKDTTADVTAFKRSLSESMQFQLSTSLWHTKAKWHRIGYFFWFSLFILITVVVVWYIVSHTDNIFAVLPHDKDNIISYSSLVFFIVPVIGIAWLLRIISRFITLQHTLADDAEHRDVMTKTYLALVSNKESQVDERDRIIMLSAIFRPLPGSQLEEVAPPTILDILKKT